MNFCKYDPRSLDRLSDHYGLVFVWKSMIGFLDGVDKMPS
jgi:hypothetical protein